MFVRQAVVMTIQRTTPGFHSIVTVTCNTAFDCVLEVPDFTVGEHLPGRYKVRHPAGKGVNVSRALASFQNASIATGFVGEQSLQEFELSLKNDFISNQFLSVAGLTRENITILDSVRSTATHIRTTGYVVTAHDIDRLKKKVSLLAKKGGLIVFSGSLPEGIEPGVFADLIQTALDKEAYVAVDTSGEALRQVIRKPLWLLKVNREELQEVVSESIGGEDNLIKAGIQLGNRISTVIVTCGEAGSYAFSGGTALMGQVDLAGETAVSSVGCGDVMLGGFISAMVSGADMRTAYIKAVAAATAAAVNPITGMFAMEDVARFEARTSILSL